MYRVLDILTPQEVAECRQIAETATFVHGKISNPHNKAKQNEQLHEQAAYQRSAKIVLDAFIRNEEFREFAFPVQIAPPLLTRYKPECIMARMRTRRTCSFPKARSEAISAAPSSSMSRRAMRAAPCASATRTRT